ncbi:MAG: hypothetical protein IT440_01705 [Phycisphaeraceae bacterium]|nr:hypothetical protein [Phycisphaeraceae bacterium]
MKRKKHAVEDMNLDSLLDTLTNVLGILLIMLVVAIIGVPAATKRIQEMQSKSLASMDELNKAKEELEKLKKLILELKLKWDDYLPQADPNRLELSDLRKKIEELTAWMKTQKSDIDMPKLQQTLADKRKEAAEAQKKVNEAMARIQQIKGQLDNTPVVAAPDAIDVRVPNPRQAPPGATDLLVICQYNRIVDVEIGQWMKLIEQRMKSLPKIPEGKDNLGGYDAEKVKSFFEKQNIGKPFLDIDVEVIGRVPHMVIKRLEDTGEDMNAIKAGNSRFQGTVRSANSANKYAKFWVYPDSYEIYVEARKIADEIGIPAGWEPKKTAEVWKVPLPPDCYCDAPRPPPPPPKPPGPPAPPPPKPTGPPPRPPLPVEQID